MIITAEYVTTEDGTGLVHTAPGHGVEDYVSGQRYDLAVYSPVKDDGRYDETVPDWLKGKSVLEVDNEVNEYLRKKGLLFAQEQIVHSYPHCWRSKTPVIFRATEQWFISVDKRSARHRQKPAEFGSGKHQKGTVDSGMGPETNRRNAGIAAGLVHQQAAKLGPADTGFSEFRRQKFSD